MKDKTTYCNMMGCHELQTAGSKFCAEHQVQYDEWSAKRQAKHHPSTPSDGQEWLFQGTSHEEGRNSVVTLYVDRIERVREHKFGSLTKAKQDTEVTPIKAVSSVQAKKDGFHTKVTVYATGNNIEFRFGHTEAQHFKDEILRLILPQPDGQGSAVPTVKADVDVMDQLRQLGQLKDEGVLTEMEFETKKSDLLSRI
jgi:Short C-terminal domain